MESGRVEEFQPGGGSGGRGEREGDGLVRGCRSEKSGMIKGGNPEFWIGK